MGALKVEGMYSPVFINVQYDGEAMINEGNRRTLIAKTLGWKYVPVEIRYFAGGEVIRGTWHPDSIAKVAKPWKRPPKPPSIKKAEAEWEKRRQEREKKLKEPTKVPDLSPPQKVPDDVKKILDLLGM
jgi:hypothetical protein